VYLQFIEDGQWGETRPDLKGIPIVIQVTAKYPPSEQALKFYRMVGPIVAQCGASLELDVTSSETTIQF